VREYLATVERESTALPPAARQELLADLSEHIEVARAERPGDVRAILHEVGDPRTIAHTGRVREVSGAFVVQARGEFDADEVDLLLAAWEEADELALPSTIEDLTGCMFGNRQRGSASRRGGAQVGVAGEPGVGDEPAPAVLVAIVPAAPGPVRRSVDHEDEGQEQQRELAVRRGHLQAHVPQELEETAQPYRLCPRRPRSSR
ncbi:HAAS signaling domain-containing protein, partial [Streptomyces microflavus]